MYFAPSMANEACFWKDDCSRQALSLILPQCLDGLETMTSSQQKEVALELSICELENVKIEYPLDCDPQIRLRNIDKCIQSLEKSPQFWTSYSGNYRNVREVCHQVSLPLKKEQIVEVYENVTNLFQHVLHDLAASQVSNEKMQSDVKDRFDTMMHVVDEVMKQRQQSVDRVNSTFNVFYENFELSLNNALVIIGQSYQGVNTNLNEVEQHINYFTKELYRINDLIRENESKLDRQQRELQERNDVLLDQQDKALDNVKGINEFMFGLQSSARQHFDSMDSELQHSVFKIHSINGLLDHNFDNLQKQRQFIKQNSLAILGDISEAFVFYLNSSGQEILESFESSLNESFGVLEDRIEKAAVSMERLDSRVGVFINVANNATEYIVNVIPNFTYGVLNLASEGYTSVVTAFSQTYKILLCLAVIVAFLMTKHFVRLVWKMVRKSFVMVIPLTLGVVAAMITLQLVLVFTFAHAEQVYFNLPENNVHSIDPEIFSNLYTYAHLIDISYCISEVHGIDPPFKCDLNCEKRFPNMTLVHQWYFPDSVTGYIASTYDNIFNYEKHRKTVVVSLRGTRSIFDTYADMKVDMTRYSNPGIHLPLCGDGCRVHDGFYKYFTTTLNNINDYIVNEIGDEDYELIIVGHSLGGSIALLLGLYYLDMGYDKLTLVTMGQPLTGNYDFVNWADGVLGSQTKLKHNEFERKFLRVSLIVLLVQIRIALHMISLILHRTSMTICKHISRILEEWVFVG
ncbi:KAR5 [Candida metapsilosis]|uniref:triacylglycerol lipase n=1 Tax=Candida metapsilosis TaxID=273372 RepID=A0A8H7ZJ22_9ASCO|nr:KAR5 [Candida metapsilosis]